MASRGRARGRSSASAAAAAAGPPAPAPVGGNAPPGRGRGRARGVAAAEAPPVEQMAAMNVGGAAVPQRAGVRERGSRYDVVVLRPENLESSQGTSGQPMDMLTNYFHIELKDKQPFYQYHVTFSPPLDNIKLRKALMYNIPEIKDKFIFDGNLMYSPMRLPEGQAYTVTTRRDEVINIGMVLTQEVDQSSTQFIQVANIILNEIAYKHMGLDRIRRDYFNPRKSIAIPQHKIELWPGYEFTIRRYSHGVLLGLDVKHKILRTDTALEFMNSIMQRNRGAGGQSAISKDIVGQIVMTKYNNKTYRVDDIDFTKKPADIVELKSGAISYVDYYEKNYNIKITDKNQPLLIHRSKTKIQGNTIERQIHLVPEVCYMTGLSDNMRSDFKIMQDLAQYTRQDPETRQKSLLGFRETIAESAAATTLLNSWGLNLSSSLLACKGRKQQPESVIMANGQPFPCDARKESFDNITRKKFTITSAEIGNDYTVICTNRDQQSATTFADTCAKVGPSAGINIGGRPKIIHINSDRAEEYIRAIRENAQNAKIVVCLVPNNKKDRYDAIKKHCCIDQPIPSQVLMGKNLNPKKAMSVTTKVVMQMNAKLGGELWSIQIPMKKVMYVGIDTYHDSGSNRSVGGFVASMNHLCTRYFSKTTWQPSKQELISQLDVCMTDALKEYNQQNGYYPERIIIFRDGVGDGQLVAVKEQELAQIKDAIKRLPSAPELVFTVVTKRIQQRFFVKQGKLVNPPPGTFVDTGVTRDELFDFFLVPQSVGQGTVTPTHYNVLEFATTLKPDHLQKIAYKLCHIYYNWTGTIRVPAVCQYAHKLAFLVGQSLHRDPSPQLANLLYYL